MVFAHGLDGGPYPMFDGLARLYISIAVVWTACLIGGIVFLTLNRNVHCVRIRNLTLAVGAVCCLHVYWIGIMIGYTLNGLAPCAAEYWIMSIYLPFGVALYQASNMQLLSLATSQSQLLSGTKEALLSTSPPRSPLQRWRHQWKEMNLLNRTMYVMWTGMAIQCAVSLSLFLGSRKFNSFGTFSEPVSPMECRHGPEWVPSIFMQFAWSWIFAPYVLWKIRHVKDVHHWRLQTTIAVIAGMPSSPLWLAALYSNPESIWGQINMYWPPPLWFVVPIMTMEAVAIFIPCYEVVSSARQQRYIANALQDWEARRHGGEGKSMHTLSSGVSSQAAKSQVSSTSSQRSELITKRAFEKHLLDDTTDALLRFAALREFSGENIVFLHFVQDWKQAWTRLGTFEQPEHRRHLFNVAVEMYADYVDIKLAEFPINIEHRVYDELHRTFGHAVKQLHRRQHDDSVAPFAEEPGVPESRDGENNSTIELVSPTTVKSIRVADEEVAPWSPVNVPVKDRRNIMTVGTRLPDDVAVPPEFGAHVWDKAEESVKYMVFVNTWPKFVDVLIEEASRVLADDAGARVERGRGMCFG